MQAYIVLMSRSCPVTMSRAVTRALIEMDVLAEIDDAAGVIEIGQQRFAIAAGSRLDDMDRRAGGAEMDLVAPWLQSCLGSRP